MCYSYVTHIVFLPNVKGVRYVILSFSCFFYFSEIEDGEIEDEEEEEEEEEGMHDDSLVTVTLSAAAPAETLQS